MAVQLKVTRNSQEHYSSRRDGDWLGDLDRGQGMHETRQLGARISSDMWQSHDRNGCSKLTRHKFCSSC